MLAEAGVAQAGLDEGLISYKWAVARRLQSRQKYEPTQVYQSKLCANDPDNFNALKFGQDRGTDSGVG
jgi:hypothetical protein